MPNSDPLALPKSHPRHTRAAIIAVGDELILGQSLDTNTQWLAEQLTDVGIIP